MAFTFIFSTIFKSKLSIGLLILLSFCFGINESRAQLFEIRPVSPQYISPGSIPSKGKSQARTESHERLSLPFFDDFSTRDTAFVDTSRWVNSNSVNISSGFGINAPSLNVLVFNGLDSMGLPYNAVDKLLNGYTDKLISARIDLSNVVGADRDSVFLNFYYQWAANGEAPDRTDYLEVSFLNDDSLWVSMTTIYGEDINDGSIFYPAIIQVSGDEFFHDDFQFRIRSFGRLSGAYDTWAVDYIYLNKSRRSDFISFPDRAIASKISPLYGRYYAAPYTHFLAKDLVDSVSFVLHNLRGGDVEDLDSENPFTGAYWTYGTFTKYIGGTISTTTKLLLDSGGATGASFLIQPLESKVIKVPYVNDPTQYDLLADSLDVSIGIRIYSEDETDVTRSPFDPWAPLDFTLNDSVYTTYPLRNHYAYDDGTAEYSVKLTQPGVRLAYRFDMPIDTASLQGFQIYFPYTAGESSESLDLLIYGDNNGEPGETPLLTLNSRTIYKTRNNQFSEYRLFEPLFINDSVFYIGYKQSPSEEIRLGIDKSNNTGDKIFVFYNNTWEQNTLIEGSLMIRPLFGKGTGVITGLPEEKHSLFIHPNPNTGTFYINDKIKQLNILDVTGKSVGWSLTPEGDRYKITLNSPASGFYIVRWRNTKSFNTAKVMVVN